MYDPYSHFAHTTLPNGLQIHALEMPGRSFQVVRVLIQAGSGQDPVGYEGLAHFVEHMVSENADMSFAQMRDFFQDTGGYAKFGSTFYWHSRYEFFVPAKVHIVRDSLELFGSMLLKGSLTKGIEQERSAIMAEFHEAHPTQQDLELAWREVRALFPGLWIERFPGGSGLGTKKAIASITEEDLNKFFDQYHVPANMRIVTVGGLSQSKVEQALIGTAFTKEKTGETAQMPTCLKTVPTPREPGCIIRLSDMYSGKVESGSYRMVAAIPGTVSRTALRIMVHMLDQLLYQEVREKRGWTYGIESDFDELGGLYAFHVSSAAIAPDALAVLDDIVSSCLATIKTDRPRFVKARQHFLAALELSDETGREICGTASVELAQQGKIVMIHEAIEEVRAVTFDQMQTIIRWLRPKRRWKRLIYP